MLELAELSPVMIRNREKEEAIRNRKEVKAAEGYFAHLIPQKYPGSWRALCIPQLPVTHDDATSENVSISVVRTPEGEMTIFADFPNWRLDLTHGTEYGITIKNGDIMPGKENPITYAHINVLEQMACHLLETPTKTASK
ncbi:MAG: hypothetical protein KBD46_03155 [Candidatus Levybacteria bacterium]|nr:hypothetical protein [Candidatus Levybacteria bacterium]